MAMKHSTKGALLLLLLAVVGIVAYRFMMPWLFEREQRLTSDAAKSSATIRIGGDDYLGYWFINSPLMKQLSARRGMSIIFTNDGGAYADRLEKFSKGEYDCIVLPVNSYLQHGAAHQYPGVFTAGISESRKADGVVGFNVGPSFTVNDLNDPSKTWVYIPDSPSSFLIDLMINDFGLDLLRKSSGWRMEVNSTEELLQAARDGRGDFYVTWEPNIMRLLEMDGMSYVFGSDKFRGYIIDAFAFHRDFVTKRRQDMISFLRTYFSVMTSYASNREEMLDGMGRSMKLDKDNVRKMLGTVEWFDLAENCSQLFGINPGGGSGAGEGLVESILACTEVLVNSGTLKGDPLKGNPYIIVNRSILEELAQTSVMGAAGGAAQRIDFEQLNDAQWMKLQPFAMFKAMDITFQSWNEALSPDGEETVDSLATKLINNYPMHRIIVRGHTSPGGDERLNTENSQNRAQAVVQRLVGVFNMDPDRIRAEGAGSSKPPAPISGESSRSYRYRHSRVEILAVQDNPF
ncbi:MAG TPA: phosphate ABC transporter substrate-binding/OmpA family protein [Candidatus Nanoarchaeia archaeon]|nr:phosphate ABC transporter substrate-binding/OmpA family protein [Candidatus Nanoarchaeia archaeon]